jgi:hypothetical protein
MTPDVPHQWLMDHLTAATMQGWISKDVAELVYGVFVQRFPDEVALLKADIAAWRAAFRALKPRGLQNKNEVLLQLEQQGDNYITESAQEADHE